MASTQARQHPHHGVLNTMIWLSVSGASANATVAVMESPMANTAANEVRILVISDVFRFLEVVIMAILADGTGHQAVITQA